MRRYFSFWASAFYFCYYGASGAFWPFLNAHYLRAGIPVEQIGLLAAMPLMMNLFASPLWNLAADGLRLHRLLLPLTMLLTVPFAWLLAQAGQFWSLGLLAAMFSFCLAPIISLGDHAVLEELGERRYEYGRLRMWGAVGYGLSAWLGGSLIETGGLQRAVYIFGAMMLAGVLISTRLTSAGPAQTGSMREGLRLLSSDSRWYIFLGSALLAGLGFTTINNYLVVYMKANGAGESLFGLSVAAAGLGELPAFFFSASLIRRWSPRGVLLFSLAVLSLRLLLISLFTSPAPLILVQVLHGITFSALWAAGVNYVRQIAPPGLGSGAQALFGATMFGLAGVLGAFLGGQFYSAWGGAALFRAAALAVLVGWITFSIAAKNQPANQPS